MALDSGATEAECTVSEGKQFSVNVRMGEVETLTEAGSRGTGVRVLVGKHTGSAYSSDLSDDGIRYMVDSALGLAKITTEDPFAGLPDPAELGRIGTDLQLYSPAVVELSTDWKIEQAKKAEAAAFAVDERIGNSEGASFDTHSGTTVFANSLGFLGSYRTSSCSMSAVPVAQLNGTMERDYWYSVAREPERLDAAEAVGRRAAERALRRLGARKVATQKVPIVFEPRVAKSLVDNLFDSVSGDAIYRQESFLAGKMGQKVASERLTMIDDATIPGLFGSCPFDDEGVPSRRTVVIENGVLKSWLLNSYTARKLGLRTTGNASRGITGNAGVGNGNLFFEPGQQSPEDIIASLDNAFYVTELIGFGVNTVTGDYSRGAAGLWIENGKLSFPVSEVTIAGTLPEMLMGIAAIGSDLEFRSSMASPTLLIREMTVSGQ
ncbi:MAG: TldD/PmbA family protein [Bryobacteraceae bacterium]|nr:TldD/PmbA family protein [Bryobacteraceae bacterium]